MKRITNWRNATVADLESDGLLEEATMIHVLSLEMKSGTTTTIDGADKARLKGFFQWHIAKGVPLVFHNGICFDIPLCERLLGMDLSEVMLIDTLPLSWYLNTRRNRHGLGSFHEDYGIEKPEVGEDEWKTPERLSEDTDETFREKLGQHKALMTHRCREDVAINKALWGDLSERLVDMYTKSKAVVDSGEVGGKRMSSEEVTYIDGLKNISVDEWVDEILTFLMMKQDHVRIKEATKWEVDTESLFALYESLDEKIVTAKETLESVMPKIPKYVTKKFPKKPTKKGKKAKKGEPENSDVLSTSGENWNESVKGLTKKTDLGHQLTLRCEGSPTSVDEKLWTAGQYEGVSIKTLSKYCEPNAGSPDQIKDFLFSHGWKPVTFELVDDKKAIEMWEMGGKRSKPPAKRKVPQISKVGENGKELCESVVKLAEKIPEIMAYQKYTTIKHRRDMVKGWIETIGDGKHLEAGCGGYTSTLREQHRGLVNLPGIDKPYGEEIRGLLIAGEGKISLGSDLSSLEDRVKHHFMLPHDPSYVATMMADDYDPHLLTAFSSGLIDKRLFDGYKDKSLSPLDQDKAKSGRKAGKATNYSSVYGAGAPTIARSAGVSKDVGEQLHKGYWGLNWSVKSIAEEQVIIESGGGKWLVNPVNGLCYALRAEKDRFSALCQGTGSYFFDLWVNNVMEEMNKEFGVKRINGLFHDEYITSFRDTEENRDVMGVITHCALEDVNQKFLLRRKLGCSVQFGKKYSEIH